jgi:hypothetical protein
MGIKEKCPQLSDLSEQQLLGGVEAMKALENVKLRVHPEVKGGGELQTLEIHGLPSELSPDRAAALLCSLDPTLDPVSIMSNGQLMLKSKMTHESGRGFGEYVYMTVTNIPVSDKMITSLNKGENAQVANWNIRPAMSQSDRSAQPMLMMKVAAPDRAILELLVAAGMSKPDLEHLIMWQLNSIVGKTAVVEVFFQDTIKKSAVDDNGHIQNYPVAIDFSQHGKAVVVCSEDADIELLIARTPTKFVLDVNWGTVLGVPLLSKLSISFMLDRKFSFEARESKMNLQLDTAVQRARELLAKINPAAAKGPLNVIQVKLAVTFVDGHKRRCREMQNHDASQLLMQTLGGQPFGVFAAVLAADPATCRVYWDGTTHIIMQGGPQGDLKASALVRRLGKGVDGRTIDTTSPIMTIRSARNETPKISQVHVRPDDAASQPAARAATTDAVQHCIAQALFASPGTFATLPVKTKQGAPIQWVTAPRAGERAATKQTELDDLPDLDAGMQTDSPDVRLILREAGLQYTGPQLFAALMTLLRDGVIEMEMSDDEQTYQLCSSTHYGA